MFLLKFPLEGWGFLAKSAKTLDAGEFFSSKVVAISLLKIFEKFSRDKYRHFEFPLGGKNKTKL